MGTNKSLMKRFDAVVFDLLKVTPEELAVSIYQNIFLVKSSYF